MIGVRIVISRYLDDTFPGWVECILTDAYGRVWSFIEKVPVVTSDDLNSQSNYPQQGVLACCVIERRQCANSLIVIDTMEPWHIESTTGETRFEIRPEQLEEF